MIPRLHPKGHSFKGAAAYLLHDKDKATSTERVAWAETRNIATEDPHVAWRVMAATAMSQGHLKERAGIKNTGRKSNAHVLHLSLAWSPEESAGVTREEMLRAVNGALRALGAEDRQAIIVSHNDEPHAHVHVLLNRVSADDGRMLSSSKEKLALSAWAEGYERDRGKIFCEERVINNAARTRGEFTRAAEKSRATIEHDGRAANDNQETSRKARLAELNRRGRTMADRHAQAWLTLNAAHKTRKDETTTHAKRAMHTQEKAIRERYRPEWTYMFHEHQAERGAHNRDEGRLIGRAENAVKAIDFAAILRAGDRRQAIAGAFRTLSSSGARLEELKRTQAAQARALALRQQREERTAAQAIAAERTRLLVENERRFLAERSSLILAQKMEKAALQTSWAEFSRSREQQRADSRTYRAAGMQPAMSARPSAPKQERPRPDVRQAFHQATQPPEQTEDPNGEDDRERRIAEFRERMRQRETERKRDQDRGRER